MNITAIKMQLKWVRELVEDHGHYVAVKDLLTYKSQAAWHYWNAPYASYSDYGSNIYASVCIIMYVYKYMQK